MERGTVDAPSVGGMGNTIVGLELRENLRYVSALHSQNCVQLYARKYAAVRLA